MKTDLKSKRENYLTQLILINLYKSVASTRGYES